MRGQREEMARNYSLNTLVVACPMVAVASTGF